MSTHPLSGIYGAAITPMKQDFTPDLEAIPQYLGFLAERSCHGALLLGTTGEGPSFEADERINIFQAALEVRQEYPDFKLLAGTGTPSMKETINLTRRAFDLGYDGVVTLPAYYYHQATIDGMYTWYSEIIDQAVPDDGYLLGYHIPAQSRVPLPIDLLSKLKDSYPDQFAGIKDSSGDPDHPVALSDRFESDLVVLVGNDALFTHALTHQGSGCITALANLYSPDLRIVWDAFQKGEPTSPAQERLVSKREILGKYTPFPATLKALVSYFYNFPLWTVRPPLEQLSNDKAQQVISELAQVD
jgi:4-hydroxy-tetrahydrodipicolinate synthase